MHKHHPLWTSGTWPGAAYLANNPGSQPWMMISPYYKKRCETPYHQAVKKCWLDTIYSQARTWNSWKVYEPTTSPSTNAWHVFFFVGSTPLEKYQSNWIISLKMTIKNLWNHQPDLLVMVNKDTFFLPSHGTHRIPPMIAPKQPACDW